MSMKDIRFEVGDLVMVDRSNQVYFDYYLNRLEECFRAGDILKRDYLMLKKALMDGYSCEIVEIECPASAPFYRLHVAGARVAFPFGFEERHLILDAHET